MTGEHIAQFMEIILEAVLASLPPDERQDPKMRANVSGAIVDGRLQVWGILGKIEGTDHWRPVGYGTTAIREDDLSGKKTCLCYSLYAYAAMDASVYDKFWGMLIDYAKNQGCAKVALFSDNEYIIERAKAVGMTTQFRYIFKNLE